MTPEQVYCVSGKPLRTENDARVDVWHLRGKVRLLRAPAVESLKFVDGRMITAGEPQS
jgi:hypothetical protein